jgi:hypothetical protein
VRRAASGAGRGGGTATPTIICGPIDWQNKLDTFWVEVAAKQARKDLNFLPLSSRP